MQSISTKVLIIDDDKQICDFINEGLSDQDCECDVALNVNDALYKLSRFGFDIVLLDIMLPEQSGIELLKYLKTLNQSSECVMITALKDFDTVTQTMRLGAADYLVKPFTLDTLYSTIDRIRSKCIRQQLFNSERLSGPVGNHYIPFNKMNSIAAGADMNLDYFDFHFKKVTERTVEVAHYLGIPGKEIEEWATARDKLHVEKMARIQSMLDKLSQNPIAQRLLGLSRKITLPSDRNNNQN